MNSSRRGNPACGLTTGVRVGFVPGPPAGPPIGPLPLFGVFGSGLPADPPPGSFLNWLAATIAPTTSRAVRPTHSPTQTAVAAGFTLPRAARRRMPGDVPDILNSELGATGSGCGWCAGGGL